MAGLNRKRKRKEKKENIIKLKKARGEEHVNHRKKLIPARQVGPNCRCKFYKCYENTKEEDRQDILEKFNEIGNKNEQDRYLMSLISSYQPKRSTTKTPIKSRKVSYSYKLRFEMIEISVCLTAFCNIHGITKGRVRRLQNNILNNVANVQDMRGKHRENRYRKTPEVVLNLIRSHINSFEMRQSHYSQRDNPNCRYLSEELTVCKTYNIFMESYQLQITYPVYWSVFKNEFNLRFGLPRSDTCATCDSLRLKILLADDDDTKEALQHEHKNHLKSVEKCTEMKKNELKKAKEGTTMYLSFDYMQNLPLPHIRTSDVFYCRQLWMYVFGIHDIGKNRVTLNSYIETEGKKGQNDVTSLLLLYLNENNVYSENLVLLSDGCPGQNKNYVMVYFLYFLVHVLGLFRSIKYIFPIRGHTFLPNDQDFSLIGNKKKICSPEVPDDWNTIMANARERPSRFMIKKITHESFHNIKHAVSGYFLRNSKPAMKLKQVRMIKIEKDTKYVLVRYSFTGPWVTIDIRNRKKMPKNINLKRAYESSLPLNPHKVCDLRKLMQFLVKPSSHQFYQSILYNTCQESSSLEVDNDDNSSGCED